jgi:competence protein ComGC
MVGTTRPSTITIAITSLLLLLRIPKLEGGNNKSNLKVSRKTCRGTPLLHMHYNGYNIDTATYVYIN